MREETQSPHEAVHIIGCCRGLREPTLRHADG